jgi:hypothetical protein
LEPWEIELEYWTWDAYEAEIAKAQGKEQYIEEVEVDEADFKAQVAELNQHAGISDEWEQIDGQKQ